MFLLTWLCYTVTGGGEFTSPKFYKFNFFYQPGKKVDCWRWWSKQTSCLKYLKFVYNIRGRSWSILYQIRKEWRWMVPFFMQNALNYLLGLLVGQSINIWKAHPTHPPSRENAPNTATRLAKSSVFRYPVNCGRFEVKTNGRAPIFLKAKITTSMASWRSKGTKKLAGP